MKLPKLRYADGIGKSTQIQFGGLNHNYGAADGEIWDMKNMTSDHYPVLATRERRRLFMKLNEPGGIYAWDKLCWVDSGLHSRISITSSLLWHHSNEHSDLWC